MTDAQTQIAETVKANDVVLFLKGTKVFISRGRRAQLHGRRFFRRECVGR